MQAHVEEIVVHPIKSCRGVALEAAGVTKRGLELDRRYMLVDAEGRFLTQREHPQMARIEVEIEREALHVTAPGRPPLRVPSALETTRERSVRIWRQTLTAALADDGINAWFTAFFGFEAALVHLGDDRHRPVPNAAARAGDEVGFADAAPLLLISTASLADLNARLEQPVPMRRFRPNVVVSAPHAFAEDGWRRLRIGRVELDVAWPCTRCVLTTVDPETGIKDENCEPLRTLRTYRRSGGGILFGQNLIPRMLGSIAVGDAVEVLESDTS